MRSIAHIVFFAGVMLTAPVAAKTQTAPPASGGATAVTDNGHATSVTGTATTDVAHAPAQSAGGPQKPADPNAQHDVSPEVAARADGDQVICKDKPIVGSRLNSRLCLTKRRWEQMHRDGQEFLRDIDQRSSGGQEGP